LEKRVRTLRDLIGRNMLFPTLRPMRAQMRLISDPLKLRQAAARVDALGVPLLGVGTEPVEGLPLPAGAVALSAVADLTASCCCSSIRWCGARPTRSARSGPFRSSCSGVRRCGHPAADRRADRQRHPGAGRCGPGAMEPGRCMQHPRGIPDGRRSPRRR
jgi:hypothetical protein